MSKYCGLLLLLFFVTPHVLCEVEWWQKTVLYQIYPRSFKDSDGDGIGDLNGITQSLDHIKDAGIESIWLSPIYKTPNYDAGYDISDFKEINPEFGTMNDFDNMIKACKSKGINLVLDFVPNHSSNESEWFNLSANRTKGYENYFVWADGVPNPSDPNNPLPPNNWVSIFRKSAWEYNRIRKQFFLHQFVIGQPDLNYRDPALVNEMKNVLRFWLDRGVDGFRVDAVQSLFEVNPDDFGGKFPDEPRSNILNVNKDDYDYLDHIYTKNLPETYDMVHQWRDVLDEYKKKDNKTRVMLTEAYEDIKLTMEYYGNNSHDASNLPFNFNFIRRIFNDSDARDIKYIIDLWLTYMPRGRTANWVNGNHDNNRMASRYGIDRADIMNMIALILPGVAVTYQGEELALTDGEVSWEETQDPQACNTDDPINYWKSSRDPARTPFQWDDSKNAGFSSGNKTWLPVAKNYKEVNLKLQKSAARSHYKFYKDIVALRKTKTMTEGKLEMKLFTENTLAFLRYMPNEPPVLGIFNVGKANEMINVAKDLDVPQTMRVYTSSVKAKLQKGDLVKTSSLELSPHDAIILIPEKSTYY